MFKIKNISKKYDEKYALNDISISIEKGMSFIVGVSGSGKSTLLKIMSGIDNDYEGSITLFNKDLKEINQADKSYLYNNVIGFIWQDFNLIEESTVLDNILLPSYLKGEVNIKQANKLMADLKLKKLENKQVKYLSGGQKQRVSIARELMKNPQVILADEPTSALDKQSAKEIMKILRGISKDRSVIIVTHDASHIINSDSIFELDKGMLISKNQDNKIIDEKTIHFEKNKLSLKSMTTLAKKNIFHHKARLLISILSIILGVSFLLTSTTNTISEASESSFDKVFDLYGNSVLDISLINKFSGGAGLSGNDDNPNVDVNQDVSGLYEKYKKDKRIEFISYLESFSNIKIQSNNQEYQLENSGAVPIINKLIAGRMANGTDNEVVVPNALIKKMGITAKEALNKTITFTGEITEWNKEEPVFKEAKIEVKIVGVMDSTLITNFEGEKYETELEDSFLFSQSALVEMLSKTNKDVKNMNLFMRAKTPSAMIEIKDEMSKKGIVPIGNFEVIEDLVRLNSQSIEQTSNGGLFITVLVFVMIVAVALVTSILRRKEYAIYKVSGFNNVSMSKLNFMEILFNAICSSVLLLIASPLINVLSKNMFNTKIINYTNYGTCIVLVFVLSLVSFIVIELVCRTTSILKVFKSGEH